MFLVANLPPTKVYIKKEYLYDHQKGHGEFVEGVWITVKSIQGRALYFETYLPEYGALYDKLPISAFVSSPDVKDDLPLEELELWDAFSYNLTVVEKQSLAGVRCKYLAPSKKWYHGEYLFTVDFAHPESNILDTDHSEIPHEHKCAHIIALDDGNFAAQPNNRCIWDIPSFTVKDNIPDWKVQTSEWNVEDSGKWKTEDTDKFFYEMEEKKHD